ncbi:hypothetical protein DPMN_048257 [Dreissena polymorpha]|uniref:C2H2-type domain-containing protein n=1 Tax=Dreissena polymorpha TaxID=45954 RepID=A0A9D4I2Q1_DREPO|nr:hypothetical protein DPMN_048257 [Dreissena polymorpha]
MFKCENCEKQFKTKKTMNRHIKDRHEIQHIHCCVQVCDRKFLRRYYLVNHLTSKHNFSKAEARRLAITELVQPSHSNEDDMYIMDVSEVDSVLDLLGEQDEEEKLGYLDPSEFYSCIKDFDFNIFTATRINKASISSNISDDDMDVNNNNKINTI